MPNRIFISKKQKILPEFKMFKDYIMLLLGNNASRNFIIKSLLIYRSLNLHALKSVNTKIYRYIEKQIQELE